MGKPYMEEFGQVFFTLSWEELGQVLAMGEVESLE